MLMPDITGDLLGRAAINMGLQLMSCGRFEQALAAWAPFVRNPDNRMTWIAANTYSTMACMQMQRAAEAEAFAKEALKVFPEFHHQAGQYVLARQLQCAWPVCKPIASYTQEKLLIHSIPGGMLALTDDPALHAAASLQFADKHVSHARSSPLNALIPLHAQQAPRRGRIRVGYLSGAWGTHPESVLTAELYELHDRSRFEVHAFSWTPKHSSPLLTRLKAAFDHYWPIAGMSHEAAAQLIAKQGIDILVDLTGATGDMNFGIQILRPAPVQVSYLATPGFGVPGADWAIADRYVMPPELLPHSIEKPIYLPDCFQLSDRKRKIGPRPTRAQCGLPEDAFVFCSFNNSLKITEEIFLCWVRMLHGVPNSVLWLAASTPQAKENMQRTAEANGIARERLVFAPRINAADHTARIPLADLCLDTFPFSGGTTVNDVLWMGVPLLALVGRSYASRMAGSLLTQVGLPDLITTSLTDYERTAILLGREPERVAAYRRHLTEHGRQSVLFDIPRTVRGLEAEFERLALEHRRS
jgi:predicted O-linked N-acetylglucosamine transferase (SPINDLY family)